jgi:Tol biopolymer transport system component/serine/threonine protein kinase
MLSPGDRLGRYEVLAPLGAGGMGEVYRARDARLDREVALKVLREEVAHDPERLRRFEREARAVAALNHPHILAVHDIGSEQGLAYVVFELLEGQTLRGLLQSGPQPARSVVDYGMQICRGLAAAHERGIVHRDLKPENVFLTEERQVKILDFGLARRSESPGEALASEASTQTASAPGRVMGTVGYMSPEQARGGSVDARSDLFSLGAILYELLSGRRAFTGRSSADTLAAILNSDAPEIGDLASGPVPPGLESVIRRCLEKQPGDRFHSAHDLRWALEALSENRTTPTRKTGRLAVPVAAAAGALLMIGALGWWAWFDRGPDGSVEPIRITPFTSDGGQKSAPALSPDGERVAYQWSGATDDNWDIYVKGLGVGARPLRLTDHPATDTVPVWSPDGRHIAFARELGEFKEQAALYTVPSLGGPERKVADIRYPPWAVPMGGTFFAQGSLSWSPNGQWLVFSEKDSEEGAARVVRYSLETGQREALTFPPEVSLGDVCPALSADGTELAFVRSGSSGWGIRDVWFQAVPGGTARRLTHEEYVSCCGLAWTPENREVLFAADKVLDRSILRVSREGGPPEPVLGVGAHMDQPTIRGSRLVYVQQESPKFDIWRVPGRRASSVHEEPQRLVTSSQREATAAYSPDGQRIAFESSRGGGIDLWVCDSDGSNAVQLTSFGSPAGSPHWSPDGRFILFDSPKSGSYDLYVIGAEGGIPRQLTDEPSDENIGTWSRDGRFIYFMSDRSGSKQIWKMSVEGGQAIQVTRHGGFRAEVSWDGRYLYYSRHTPSGIWRVPVTGGEETEVVRRSIWWGDWALARSGIYFATHRSQVRREEYSIEFFDFASSEVTEVFREAGPLHHLWLAVSPDESWLLYSANPPWQSELMLVENFR